MVRLLAVVTLLAVLVPATAGCADALAAGSRPAASGTAMATLDRLAVKGRAARTGYSRKQFGPAWADTDRTGCDQRNQVLARDLNGVRFKAGTRDCVVVSGRLTDPYTGRVISFVRGPKTSEAVQIDHVVSLSDAWQTGAQQLSATQRELLATDLLELLAVSGTANDQKRDGDAASWLPAAKAYRCRYVARQVAVKQRYRLWVTPAERDAIAAVLDQCPGQPLPAG